MTEAVYDFPNIKRILERKPEVAAVEPKPEPALPLPFMGTPYVYIDPASKGADQTVYAQYRAGKLESKSKADIVNEAMTRINAINLNFDDEFKKAVERLAKTLKMNGGKSY